MQGMRRATGHEDEAEVPDVYFDIASVVVPQAGPPAKTGGVHAAQGAYFSVRFRFTILPLPRRELQED